MSLSDNRPDALKIRIPASLGEVVGMTDSVPVHRSFVANCAARHYGNLPLANRSKV
jgi:hypothetical protein